MEIKNRQKLLIIGAVALMLLLVGDSLVIEPLYQSWNSRAQRISKLKEDVAHGELLMSHEQVIRSRWEGMRTNTLPANTSLAEAEFLKTFDRCARDSGIAVTSYRPQWKNGDDYTTYECRADINGNIETISRFLYELENDPLALKLESMEIATHDDKGQQLSLGIQISSLLLTPTAPQP